MKTGRNLIDLAQELTRQCKAKKDMIVPSQLMRFATDSGGRSKLTVETPDGPSHFGVTDLARRQLAEKLGIPYAYFERMREKQPDLLDRNVNTWLYSEADRRMVRTLDGNVRAVLSDRYRRLDNYDLAEQVLPILERLPGGRLASVELTETRMYLKWITSEVREEIQPGDIVEAGVVLTNSEVGLGSLSVQPLVYRLVCRNGLIASDHTMRKTHLGRLKEAKNDSVIVFKDDTMEAEDRAFFLKVRDTVESAVSDLTFSQLAERMRRTLGIVLSNSKSIRGLAARLQENEAEKRRLCKARESCTLDRAAMLGEEFGHCSEGGSTTQGSAELTAPAFPRRECLSDRRDGHPPIASLAGVIPRSGPRFKPVASRPERRRAAFKAADSPERRRWPPAQRLLLRYTVRSRLMPCGFGWRLISATSTTPASMTQRGENGSVALVAGVKETAA